MQLISFLETLTIDDLVLTVNRRLATYLQKTYDSLQIERGSKAWPSLQIFPLMSWVEQIWETKVNDPRMLITDFQEHYLWEECIKASPIGEELLNIQTTAKLAQDTWKLLQQWQLDMESIPSPSLDVQTFIDWAHSFKEKCSAQQMLSRSELLGLLIEKLSQPGNPISIPENIYLVGFDDLSPAIKKLQNLVNIKNTQFTQGYQATTQLACYADKQEELQEMARWAYRRLLANPGATIGCVLPNLTENRNDLIRIFQEVFYADGIQDYFNAPPFNISAADKLSDFPIVQIAIKILQLNANEIELEDLSCLLRTPFIKGAEIELGTRAKLDVKLRSLGEKTILLDNLLANDLLKETCPLLYTALNAFNTLTRQQKIYLSAYDCAALFVNQLNAIGWPGERTLNSQEFQLLERFKKLFTELCSIAPFRTKMTITHALHLLKKLTNNTLFQPKSEDLPIQILGALEASGMTFNALWVAGLDNETWPAPSAPNPFIPIEIQKKLAMPHATSERELQFSLNITTRFLQSAKDVVFSYAKLEGDRPLAPSPLIAHYPLMKKNDEPYISIEKKIFATREFEVYQDDFGPLVTEEDIPGGSAILKAQAACPFQAFASFRLHAKAMEEAQLGLAAHERGSLVHTILATIWSEIKNHTALCMLDEKELMLKITSAIDLALLKIKQKKPNTLKKGFLSLEKNRLQKLIYNWLQYEKLRQPFEVVSCEQKQGAKVRQLSMQVQIDRIDRLQDGSEIIIDYKTGKPSILDWFSERPKEPQLPLYTLIKKETLSGILFAQVRIDELIFKGLAAHSDLAPGATTVDQLKNADIQDIPALIDSWHITLQKLADDFCQGNAKVDPKDDTTCQYCQLQGLCRIGKFA